LQRFLATVLQTALPQVLALPINALWLGREFRGEFRMRKVIFGISSRIDPDNLVIWAG